MNDKLLGIYLDDHLSGAIAAVELVEHWLDNDPPDPLGSFLRELLADIKQDQATLRDLHARVGGHESTLKDAAAWLTDKVSRLKLNELSKHREMSRLEKLEELALGIHGKHGLWAALEAVTQSDDRFSDIDFQRLKERARQQHDRVERHRIEAARKAFTSQSEKAASDT